MAGPAEDWLRGWAAEALQAPGHADEKAAMKNQAAACARDATAAGFSIADLKAAAGGDLEVYLLRQQNAGRDR